MPYSGPGDKTLPSNVQKLPAKKRAQWVEVFNQTYTNCMSDSKGGGAGSQKTCEATAFKFANGVAKKELEAMEEAQKEGRMISTANAKKLKAALDEIMGIISAAGLGGESKEAGEKYHDGPVPVAIVSDDTDYHPYGGATTFEQADSYQEEQDKAGQIQDQTYMFQQLLRNILGNDDLGMDEKAALIQQAASELPARVANPPKPPWRKEIVEKAKEMLFGQKVTKTEGGQNFPAVDYAYVPDVEKPSTWKLRLTESPGKMTVAQVARAITALQPGGYRGQKVDIPTGDKGGVVSKISAAIGKIAGASDDQKATLRKRLNAIKEAGSAFLLTKDAKGDLRWLTITSNCFYDRDEEVFPESVHKEAIAHATKDGDYPELWLWHTPGTRAGKGDWCDYADGFRFDSGTIDPGMEGVALKLAVDADLGVSHGFKFVREGDTYVQYRTHEVSPLPRRFAANPWTGLMVEKEDKDMGFSEEKRAFLVDKLGEEKVAKIEEGVGQLRKDIEGAGVAFKDLLDEGSDTGGESGSQAVMLDLGPLKETLETIATGQQAIQESLSKLEAQGQEHDKAIKELQKTDDEKVAALAAPKGAIKPGDSPANKDETTVKDADGNPVEHQNGDSPVSPFVAQAAQKLGLGAE